MVGELDFFFVRVDIDVNILRPQHNTQINKEMVPLRQIIPIQLSNLPLDLIRTDQSIVNKQHQHRLPFGHIRSIHMSRSHDNMQLNPQSLYLIPNTRQIIHLVHSHVDRADDLKLGIWGFGYALRVEQGQAALHSSETEVNLRVIEGVALD